MNAYAKMDHKSPALFEAVAQRAIPLLPTFNTQDLANTVNAYARMKHKSPVLFDAIAQQGLARTHRGRLMIYE